MSEAQNEAPSGERSDEQAAEDVLGHKRVEGDLGSATPRVPGFCN